MLVRPGNQLLDRQVGRDSQPESHQHAQQDARTEIVQAAKLVQHRGRQSGSFLYICTHTKPTPPTGLTHPLKSVGPLQPPPHRFTSQKSDDVIPDGKPKFHSPPVSQKVTTKTVGVERRRGQSGTSLQAVGVQQRSPLVGPPLLFLQQEPEFKFGSGVVLVKKKRDKICPDKFIHLLCKVIAA